MYDIDDYVLHTHPDLVEQFIKLTKVPDQLAACLGAAYGYPVLVSPINNILFATAIGMDDLLIRLPEAAREGVFSSFSKVVKLARDDDFFTDFGEDWIVGDAWEVPQEVLFSWLTIAYAFTGTSSYKEAVDLLENEPFSSQMRNLALEREVPFAEEPNEAVRRLVLAGEKNRAYMLYREQTGLGLRDAKEVIDRWEQTRN
jgi:ribosomal protein L7/L12